MAQQIITDTVRNAQKELGIGWWALFAASETLVCCALPILLVSLGLGATVAALTHRLPILITLSAHKEWVFAGSATLLAASGWLLYRPGRQCPADPALAALCHRAQMWNRRLYWGSIALWTIGFFATYLALPLRIALGL